MNEGILSLYIISVNFGQKHLYFRDKLGFWGWLKRPLKISLHEPFFEGSNMGMSPYCWRGCIEHDFAKGLEIQTIIGTEARVVEIGS